MRLSAVALVFAMLAAPVAAHAQSPGKVWRIGYVSVSTPELDRTWVAAFQEGLRELGYVEGQNTIIERRHAAGRADRLPALVTEVVSGNADILVIYGGLAGIEAAKKASRTIPIVFTVSADPVGAGIVASLERPGGQVTGLSDGHGSTAHLTKRLELLKEADPSLSRVAVLLDPTTPANLSQFRIVQGAAQGLGLTLLAVEIKGSEADDVDRAFAAMATERPGAVFVIPNPITGRHIRLIGDLAVKHRLPAIGTVRAFAENGTLMAYGTNFANLWRRAATYVDKIFKGARPGDLPIEQASKWDLVINLKTAKALGLTLPQSLLARAEQINE